MILVLPNYAGLFRGWLEKSIAAGQAMGTMSFPQANQAALELSTNFVYGLSGWQLQLVKSFVFSLMLCGFLIFIGYLVNCLEIAEMKCLSRLTSHKIAYFICNRLTFLGVMIHELSHALFVVLTGAKLHKISLFEFSRDGTLGHIEFCPRGPKWKQYGQMALISCAPVFMGIFFESILLRVVLLHSLNGWVEAFLWYLIISIFCHMSMSSVDIKYYMKGMILIYPSCVLIMMLIQILMS